MSIVVPQLQYTSGGKPVAIASSRRTVKVMPEAGTSGYTPGTNNTIRIDLSPSLGFLDAHNSFLSFRVKTKDDTVDHSKVCRMDKNSMSWVRRFTIHSSTGSILEDIDHYNLVVNLLHTTTGGMNYSKTIGQMIDNTGDRACRNAAMANPKGAQFNSGFDASGIMNGEGRYLPLSFMQGPMTLELVLADFKDCFVGTGLDGNDPQYQIDNVEYHANVLSMSEEYNAKFSEQLRTRGIDMSFDTYKVHVTTLTSPNMDLPISQNSASVKGSYHVLRSKDKYSNANYDSLSTYKSGNLEEVMWDLGGQLYPTQPLKLKDDGVTSLYTHNLQSFNYFRNHNLGCQVNDRNFWSSEASTANQVPTGSASVYKALPIRRVYGTWVANSKDAYKSPSTVAGLRAGTIAVAVQQVASLLQRETAVEALIANAEADKPHTPSIVIDGDHNASYVVTTLHFVPDDPKDVVLVEQGLRCKMGLAGKLTDDGIAEEKTDALDIPIKGTPATFTNLATEANVGLDRFFLNKPTAQPAAYTDVDKANDNNYKDTAKNVMYAGAPTMVTWGGLKNDGSANNDIFVSGLGVPFVDSNNHPILSKEPAFRQEGWCDLIPSDENFYISNNFETFMENSELVSGSDLTNATPLHIRLIYQGRFPKQQTSSILRTWTRRMYSPVSSTSTASCECNRTAH